MNTALRPLALLASLAAALAAPAAAQPKAAIVTVAIHDDYQPATVKIKPGESVRFVNKDDEKHTVTADNGLFDSKALAQNKTFTRAFAKAGAYPYHCTIHPNMKGTVIVK